MGRIHLNTEHGKEEHYIENTKQLRMKVSVNTNRNLDFSVVVMHLHVQLQLLEFPASKF